MHLCIVQHYIISTKLQHSQNQLAPEKEGNHVYVTSIKDFLYSTPSNYRNILFLLDNVLY